MSALEVEAALECQDTWASLTKGHSSPSRPVEKSVVTNVAAVVGPAPGTQISARVLDIIRRLVEQTTDWDVELPGQGTTSSRDVSAERGAPSPSRAIPSRETT